jgi:Zn-finger nucleic acid-binding protein
MFTKYYVMAYAGMAAATGQLLDIPIVLRSLVTSLSLITKANFPVPFDSEFVALLEVGTTDEEFGRVVKSYAYSWWDKRRKPEDKDLLHAETLHACLDYHAPQLLKSNQPRKTVPPQEIIVTPPFQLPDMGPGSGSDEGGEHDAGEDDAVGAEGAGEGGAVEGSGSGPGTGEGTPFQGVVFKIRGSSPRVETCEHCAENGCMVLRALCSRLYDETNGLERFLSAMTVSSKAEVDMSQRRAAGLYRLHERSLEKELLSESIDVIGTGRGTHATRLGRRVAEIAAEELQRYKAMPSQKWTWGETLTKDDVLSLRHIRKEEVRTGYETSLPQGTLSGVFSGINTAPSGSVNVDSVPSLVNRPPSTTSLLFPSNSSLRRDAPRSAEDAPGSEVDEEDMGVIEEEAGPITEEDEHDEDDVVSVAMDMWLEDAAGAAEPPASTYEEEEGDEAEEEEDKDEDAAACQAAQAWLDGGETESVPAPAPRLRNEQENEADDADDEEEDDEEDAVSQAADAWLDGVKTDLVPATGSTPAPQNAGQLEDEAIENDIDDEDEASGDDEDDPASEAAHAWLEGGVTQVTAAPSAPAPANEDGGEHEGVEDEDEDEDDAASQAANAWMEGGDAVSGPPGALAPAPDCQAGENEDDEEADTAAEAANAWLEGGETMLVPATVPAPAPAPSYEEDGLHEDEDDEDEDENEEEEDPASQAADAWFESRDTQPIGAGEVEDEDEEKEEEEDDEDEDEDDDPASAAVDLWFEDEVVEDEEEEDPASAAADMWLQAENPTSAVAGLSQPRPPNQVYTTADFPTEWLGDDADAEHDLDTEMED